MNRLHHLIGVALATVAAVLPAQDAGSDTAAWQPHRATKVLYAGWPGGSREKVFQEFLKQHFDKVGIHDLAKLKTVAAADYDVVVADWCSQYGNDGYPKRENSIISAPVDLGPEFTKPVIAMSYVSTNLRGKHKLDWL